jgi:hypothetical protein
MHGGCDFLFGAVAHGITSISASDDIPLKDAVIRMNIRTRTALLYQKSTILSIIKVKSFVISTKPTDCNPAN